MFLIVSRGAKGVLLEAFVHGTSASSSFLLDKQLVLVRSIGQLSRRNSRGRVTDGAGGPLRS